MADKAHFVHNIVSNIDRARPMKKKGYVHYSRQMPAKTAMKASKLPPEPKKEHEVPKVDNQYIDAKIESAELRMENKLSRLENRLDGMDHKIDALIESIADFKKTAVTFPQLVSTVVAALATGTGIFISIIAFGGDREDAGYGKGSSVESRLFEQRMESDARVEELKELIKGLQQPAPPVEPK